MGAIPPNLKLLPSNRKHLCIGVFQKQEPNIIIGWCGLDGETEIGKIVLLYKVMKKAGMVQNSFYDNGDYIFAIDKETFLNFKR